MKLNPPENRVAILSETIACMAGFVGGTLAAYYLLVASMESRALALGWATIIAQSAILGALVSALLTSRLRQKRRRRRAATVIAPIRDQMVACAMGIAPADSLSRYNHSYPLETEACMVESLGLLRGEQRARLSLAAEKIGLTNRWRRHTRSWFSGTRRQAAANMGLLDLPANHDIFEVLLRDHDVFVRIEALRALARIAEPEELLELFEFAAGESPMVQALMSDALRPAAPTLCEAAIACITEWKDPGRIAAALEMIRAWQLSLPLPLGPLLEHPQAQVRARAFALLPYAAGLEPMEESVIRGLGDPDPAVRVAAAEVAGKLKVDAAVPLLAAMVREVGPEVARAAAFALAGLGPRGARELEAEIVRGAAGASQALEALEKLRVGRSGESLPA